MVILGGWAFLMREVPHVRPVGGQGRGWARLLWEGVGKRDPSCLNTGVPHLQENAPP